MQDTHRHRDRSQRPKRIPCMWPGCPLDNQNASFVDSDTPICLQHGEMIYNKWQMFVDYSAKKDSEKTRWQQETNAARIARGAEPIRGTAVATVSMVYYLLIGDHIKIGWTADITRRIRDYPPNAVLLGLERGDKALERQRHQKFHAYLIRGREWFQDHQEIRDHIATLPVIQYDHAQARSVQAKTTARTKTGAFPNRGPGRRLQTGPTTFTIGA